MAITASGSETFALGNSGGPPQCRGSGAPMPAAPPTGGACVRAVAARMCCATRVYAVRSSNEEKRLVDHESQQYTNFRERAARKSVRCTASDGLAKYAVIKIDPNHHTKPREWAPPKRISKTNNDTSCLNQTVLLSLLTLAREYHCACAKGRYRTPVANEVVQVHLRFLPKLIGSFVQFW